MVTRSQRIGGVLAWGGAASLALGAWLALPGDPGSPPGSHVLLYDASTSAVATRPTTWRPAVAAAIERGRERARELGAPFVALPYGLEARIDASGAGPSLAEHARGEDATLLGECLQALSVGLRVAAVPTPIAALEVVGDGTWTGTDPAPHAARLALQGIAVSRSDLPSPELDNAGVAPLASPIRVRRGEPIALPIEAWWWPSASPIRPRTLRIAVEWTEGGRPQRAVRALDVSAPEFLGGGPFASLRTTVALPALESPRRRVAVRASLLDAVGNPCLDPIPEDDAAAADLLAEGDLSVGLAGDETVTAVLEVLLGRGSPGLALVRADLAAAPAGLDVLVTADRPLTAEERDRVDGFVRAGGGWLDLAGWRWTGAEPAACAALRPGRAGPMPREIAVLVDASGSMTGAPFAAAHRALAALIETAPVDAALSVRCFAGEIGARIELGAAGARGSPAGRREALRALDAGLPEPSGPTRLWGALESLAREEAGGRERLLVVVSDGRDADRAGIAARAAALRSELGAARAHLTVVAVGADPDREILGALAGGAGEVLEGGDLGREDAASRLVASLQRALGAGAVEEGRALRVQSAPAPGPLARAVPSVELPAARRLARAHLADESEAVWVDARGEPVLALRRAGLGLCAGLAFLPASDWAPEWATRVDLLLPVLRAIAPPPDAQRPRLVERAGELVLEGLPDGAPAILTARFHSEHGDDLGQADLLAARPDRDPLRERSAPLPAALARLAPAESVRALVEIGPRAGGTLSLTFAAPRASEFARSPGVFDPPPPPAEASRPPTAGSRSPHPAAPAALVSGLALLAASAFLGFFSRSRA